MPVTIQSQDLIAIDNHFRVSAGPGAGKTSWLVSHIKQVLQTSTKLATAKKVCCITYTNVAVDTILRRLDFAADKVDVSTIHSFIYKNIVKPYGKFIPNTYELAIEKVDGHDDHFVSQRIISEWVNNHTNAAAFAHPYTANQMTQLSNNKDGIASWLKTLHYEFDGTNLKLVADNSGAFYLSNGARRNLSKANCLDKLAPGLMDYKKIFWRRGILHHDDVLFFGYKLLQSYPFIIKVLRAKFPYFFIDEFQDTSPIQTAILKLVGAESSIVGIIGDKAQSIYSFQGASPQDFSNFTLPGLIDYEINDNWRSTNEIVTALNRIRTDIQQLPQRQISDIRPIILVGNMVKAYEYIETNFNTDDIATLSWDNITANSMKRNLGANVPSRDLVEQLIQTDSNKDRRRAVVSCLSAVELAREKRFKEAIKEMSKNYRSVSSSYDRKKKSFSKLYLLISKYNEFRNQPLIQFYNLVKTHVRDDIARLTTGAAATFFNNNTYNQVATGINIDDDISLSRTIHKAKGAEFDNVMLILKSDSELTFAITPNLMQEQHRLYYVAISRAKDRLFINVPSLANNKLSALTPHFTVVNVV